MALDQKIEQLEKLLEGHVNGKVIDYTVTRLTKPGDNFLSLILRVDIKLSDGEKEEILNTVAKLVPPAQLRGDIPFFQELGEFAFNNEIVWYEKVVPLFKNFTKENGVEELTDFYPTFYGGRVSLTPGQRTPDKNAVVLLENLQGYANADRLIGFDFETSKDVLEGLAKFHGVGIAFRHHRRKEFDEKVLPYVNSKPTSPHPSDFYHGTVEMLKEDPECAALLPRYQEVLKNDPFNKRSYEYREPWGTTVHDDFWTNNMMIKSTPGTPKVKIVDYQMVVFKSVAVDLVFFLMTSVENSVQKTRLDELIRFYYDKLMEVLKKLKVNTDPFTYEGLQKELEIECKAGQFAHSLRFASIIYADRGAPDVIMKMDKDFAKKMMLGQNPRQKEKSWGITKICAQKNWI